MKKLFTLILISMIAFNAIHAHIIYNLSDDGTLNISGTDMPDYTLVSPGQGIVYSSAPWHNDRDKIKKVVIKEGVSNIGRNAFYDCPNLTSVTISNTVESIKEKAFYLCSHLKTITIPNSVMHIGQYAFESSGLTTVTILKGITSIGSYAFYGCTGLTSITIPNSVTSIGSYAFEKCI